MIGGFLTLLIISVGVQLYRPSLRVGAIILGVTTVGALLLVTLVADGIAAHLEAAIFVVPMLVLAALHPGCGRSVRDGPPSIDGWSLLA